MFIISNTPQFFSISIMVDYCDPDTYVIEKTITYSGVVGGHTLVNAEDIKFNKFSQLKERLTNIYPEQRISFLREIIRCNGCSEIRKLFTSDDIMISVCLYYSIVIQCYNNITKDDINKCFIGFHGAPYFAETRLSNIHVSERLTDEEINLMRTVFIQFHQ